MSSSATTIKERPLLFSGAMVRALLAGSKTQTRRVVKMRDGSLMDDEDLSCDGRTVMDFTKTYPTWQELRCPYGQPGTRLWVRETFRYTPHLEAKIKYRADYGDTFLSTLAETMATWKPSIFMPRVASRILLEITAVRCERLQDISEADAVAEGVKPFVPVPGDGESMTAKQMYARLWESINGPNSWAANPWVWVVEFKVVDGKEAASA